jgi:hypothetical protein
MGNVNDGVWVFLVLAIGLAFLFFKRRELKKAAMALVETFKEEVNNLPRGGPPTPMHPSPAGDDALLRRRSSKNVGVNPKNETAS